MRLTREQAEEVIQRLGTVAHGGIVCPICGHRQWSVNDLVIESREFQNGNIIIGGESAIMPFVSITCRNCANTLLLNAIQLGIVNRNSIQPPNTNQQAVTHNE